MKRISWKDQDASAELEALYNRPACPREIEDAVAEDRAIMDREAFSYLHDILPGPWKREPRLVKRGFVHIEAPVCVFTGNPIDPAIQRDALERAIDEEGCVEYGAIDRLKGTAYKQRGYLLGRKVEEHRSLPCLQCGRDHIQQFR